MPSTRACRHVHRALIVATPTQCSGPRDRAQTGKRSSTAHLHWLSCTSSPPSSPSPPRRVCQPSSRTPPHALSREGGGLSIGSALRGRTAEARSVLDDVNAPATPTTVQTPRKTRAFSPTGSASSARSKSPREARTVDMDLADFNRARRGGVLGTHRCGLLEYTSIHHFSWHP